MLIERGLLVNGRYEVVRPLGEGGMGSVYLARDTYQGNNEIALKILRPEAIDPEALQRFRDEFASMTRLRHPNLVDVHDFGMLEDNGGRPFLTMEYVPGHDLTTLGWPEVRQRYDDLVTQCLRALDYIHSRGLLHNDIKPQNILVRDPFTVKLVDFGLAQQQTDPAGTGVSGTVHYIAPERFAGAAPAAQSDLYSLGVVLYELMAGRLPFPATNTGRLITTILEGSVPPPSEWNPETPERMQSFVLTLLSRDPAARPSCASAALELLNTTAPSLLSLDTPETCASFVTSGRLVGREADLDALTDFAREHVEAPSIDRGKPRVVLLTGAAGMGKTRLLRELKHRLQLSGTPTLTARCFESGGVPFQPFVDVLRQLPRREGLPPGPAQALDQVIGSRPARKADNMAAGAGAAVADKRAFIAHLAGALDHLSCSKPGVLLLEELHWGEAPAIELMEHLAMRSARSPWLIVGSLRDEQARGTAVESLLNRSVDTARVRCIALKPLTPGQVTELLGSMVPFEKEPAGLAGLLMARTGGNPFYIEELMKTLANEGTLKRRGATWSAEVRSLDDLRLPADLAGVVVKRLASLGDAEREVARALAVFNRPVTQQLLLRALGRPSGDRGTTNLVEALERLRLVTLDATRDGPTLIDLTHNQVREALYRGLSEQERGTLHLEAGQAIEAEYAASIDEVIEELAHHYTVAGKRDRAVDYLLRAADKAAALFNPLRCMEYLRQAIDLLPAGDTARRRAALRDISFTASTDLGDHVATLRYARLLEEEARLAGDRVDEAKALRYQSWAMSFLGEDDQSVVLATRALAAGRAAGDHTEVATCLGYLGMAHARRGKHREALPFFDEATSIYRSLEIPTALIMALNNAALCHLGLGEPEITHRLLEEVLSIARENRLTDQYHRYLSNLGPVRLDLGDLPGAIEATEEAAAWSREHSSLEAAGHQLVTLGLLYGLRGLFHKAIAALEEARGIRKELGDLAGQMMILDYLGNCRREIGRPDLAQEIHREGYDLARRLGVRMQEGHLLASLAADALAAGSVDLAENHAREALAIGRDLRHPRITHHANCVLGGAAARRGDRRTITTMSRRLSRQDARPLRMHDRLERNLVLGRLALAVDNTAVVERETRAGLELAERGGFLEYLWKFLALQAELLAHKGLSEKAREAYNEAYELIRQIASAIEDMSMRKEYEDDPARRQVAAGASETGAHPAGVVHRPAGDASPSALRMLESVYEITQVINSILDPRELLNKVMDLALENVAAERGLIFLYRSETDEMEMVVGRNIERQTTEDAIAYSRSILKDAWSGRSVVSHDAVTDERFKNYSSVATHHIRSLMCVPLRLKDRMIGTVYVDTRKAGTVFTAEDLRFLEAFANQAAIAIENARLHEEVLRENQYLKQAVQERYGFENIVGRSGAMHALFELLSRISGSTLPVMIRGESGTGKELVARAIHQNSPRRDKNFCSENCAALPDTILESELFGHVRGAFTGADTMHKGLFEVADQGTLFMDEVGDMSLSLQSKLLRVLESGEIRPVGAESVRRVDVRIICATNRDLEAMIKEKTFREDLYFRMNVILVKLPPLRDRQEDIPLLVDHFLAKVARENSTPKLRVEPALMAALSRHHWPGNVRELENQVYRLALFAGGDTITLADAMNDVQFSKAISTPATRASGGDMTADDLTRALLEANGDRAMAARLLGISRATLFRKIRQFDVNIKPPRPQRRSPSH